LSRTIYHASLEEVRHRDMPNNSLLFSSQFKQIALFAVDQPVFGQPAKILLCSIFARSANFGHKIITIARKIRTGKLHRRSIFEQT